jgi:hypothetical protein
MAVLLLAGCSSTRVELNSGGAPAPTSSNAGLHVQSSSNRLANALILISILAAAAEYNSEERPFPDPRALISGNREPAPPLAPDRRVSEQDCSQPVDFSAGNIRCK